MTHSNKKYALLKEESAEHEEANEFPNQHVQEVKMQLGKLLRSSAAAIEDDDQAGNLEEQRMLLKCFLEDRRIIQSLNSTRDNRVRFPFLYSQRCASSGVAEKLPHDPKEDEEIGASDQDQNRVDGSKVDPTQQAVDGSQLIPVEPQDSVGPENEPSSSHNSMIFSSRAARPSASMVFGSIDHNINLDVPFFLNSQGPRRSSTWQQKLESRQHQLQQQLQQQQQPPAANHLVWHRCTEFPFDTTSSKITVKTPVLPLLQGGHLAFLTGRYSGRQRHYSMKIVKKASSVSRSTQRRPMGPQVDDADLAIINKDEFLVLKKLAHPCVANLLYFCEHQSLCYYFFPQYMFANLSADVSVFNRHGTYTSVYITCCIINAVEYLYRNCVVHRDISSQSVMFSCDGRPVLFHFDYATFHGALRSEAKATFLPDLATRAPEVTSQDFYKTCSHEYYPNCDVWGIGILFGELLLSTKVMMRTMKRKLDMHWVFSVREAALGGQEDNVPSDLMNLLKCCLRKCPQDRPTIHSLMANRVFAKYQVANINDIISQPSPVERVLVKKEK